MFIVENYTISFNIPEEADEERAFREYAEINKWKKIATTDGATYHRERWIQIDIRGDTE